MAFQVAVSSLDGIHINQHFGRSKVFLIYRIEEDGSYRLLEERRLHQTPCGNGRHSDDALQLAAQLLADCSIALVARIGGGADKVLASKGIKAFEIYDTIENGLSKLVRYLHHVRTHKVRNPS